MPPPDNKEKGFHGSKFLVLLFAILIGGGVILLGFVNAERQANAPSTVSVTTTLIPTIVATSGLTATVTPTMPPVREKILLDITEAGSISCSVKGACRVISISGRFTRGTTPQGDFIAVRGLEKWQSVYNGTDIPNCEVVDKHSIPEEIYVNCIEESGEKRND